ncbi:MAG: PAS domain-containing protein [Salibacteraceae bacterium]
MEVLNNNRLIEGIAQVTNELIVNPNLGNALNRVARDLTVALEVGCCFIYENHSNSEGVTQSATANYYFATVPPPGNITGLIHLEYDLYDGVLDRMEAKECFTAFYSTSSGNLLQLLEESGVRSFIMVPIFKGQHHWGNIGFNDSTVERQWTELEKTVLHSIGAAIGAAVARQEHEKEMEVKLEEGSRKFVTLLGNLPGMVYRCRNNQDWTMEFISKGAFGLTGYLPEDLIQSRRIAYNNVIHEEDRDMVWSTVQDAVKNHHHFELKYRIVTANQELKWVWEQGEPVYDTLGEVEALEGFITDITDSMHAEQTLRKNERQLSMIYNNTNDLMVLFEVKPKDKHTIVSVNRRLDLIERLAEEPLKRADLEGMELGHFINEVLHLRNQEGHYYEIMDEILNSRKMMRFDDQVTTASGFTYFSDTSWVPITDERDKVTHVLYVERDVTEHKQAERALIESETRLKALMGNLPGMVYRCKNDENWSTLFVSDGCYELTGITPEEFTEGRISINEIIIPEYLKSLRDECLAAIEEKRPYEVIYPIRVADRIKWVWEKGQKIGNDAKGCELLEGFMSDITDRKNTEEKILATIIETEDRERKRIAKELHDSLGQNLTTASLHLDAVRKELHLLNPQKQEKFTTGFNFLNQAIAEARNISHNLMPKAIEDFGYVLATESLIDNLIPVTNIQFEFYNNLNGERLPEVIELNLYRITQEAINNLVKYANASKVTLQLIRHFHSVILTIEDNGIGFDTRKLKDKTATFGIHSMQSRASSVKGELHIDSAPGSGTNLTVEIPLTPHQHDKN